MRNSDFPDKEAFLFSLQSCVNQVVFLTRQVEVEEEVRGGEGLVLRSFLKRCSFLWKSPEARKRGKLELVWARGSS